MTFGAASAAAGRLSPTEAKADAALPLPAAASANFESRTYTGLSTLLYPGGPHMASCLNVLSCNSADCLHVCVSTAHDHCLYASADHTVTSTHIQAQAQ